MATDLVFADDVVILTEGSDYGLGTTAWWDKAIEPLGLLG